MEDAAATLTAPSMIPSNLRQRIEDAEARVKLLRLQKEEEELRLAAHHPSEFHIPDMLTHAGDDKGAAGATPENGTVSWSIGRRRIEPGCVLTWYTAGKLGS
jgi:hypothetical protein